MEKSHYIILPKANQKKLILTFEITQGTPEYFIGDSQKIGQIIINLLHNAVKFTKKGTVKTLVSFKENNVIFKVSDTGIGVPDNKVQFLFSERRIVNEDATIDSEYAGCGIGLLLCDKLSKLMGGEVFLEKTVVDVGSDFIFTIPLKVIEIFEDRTSDFYSNMKNRYVLLVDDNISNRLSISGILAKYGMLCIPTSSLREALIISKSIKFDIGLIDIQLDSYSGLDVAKELRKNGYRYPLIALSSLGDKTPYLADYFKFHLSKPIRQDKLLDYIGRCISELPRKDLVLPANEVNNTRILIAEDTPINQRVMSGYLNTLNYSNVVIVDNGLEALEVLSKQDFDIVFLDIKMPHSGIQTHLDIKKMFKNSRRTIPICIALTAYVIKEGYTQTYNFDDYLYKPCTIEKLEQVLKKFSPK